MSRFLLNQIANDVRCRANREEGYKEKRIKMEETLSYYYKIVAAAQKLKNNSIEK
jgi:hypothetical protein